MTWFAFQNQFRDKLEQFFLAHHREQLFMQIEINSSRKAVKIEPQQLTPEKPVDSKNIKYIPKSLKTVSKNIKNLSPKSSNWKPKKSPKSSNFLNRHW